MSQLAEASRIHARSLKISPISLESPNLSAREFEALKADIRAHGQLVPIWIHGDEIVDGRKRYQACQELGIEVKSIQIGERRDREATAHALNILRTHYTASQRGLFASKLATAKSGTSKQKALKLRGKANGSKFRPVTTVQEAAQLCGISRPLVFQAKKLRHEASPEVIRAVENGDLTIHAAKQITTNVPLNQQSEVIEKVLASRKGKRQRLHTREAIGVQKPRKHHMPPIERRMETVLSDLNTGVRCAGEFLEEETAQLHPLRHEWIKGLRSIRAKLSQTINREEK